MQWVLGVMSLSSYIHGELTIWIALNQLFIGSLLPSLAISMFSGLFTAIFKTLVLLFTAGVLLPLLEILSFRQISVQGYFICYLSAFWYPIKSSSYILADYISFFLLDYQNSSQKVKEVAKYMNFRSTKGDCVFGGHYTLSEDKVNCLNLLVSLCSNANYLMRFLIYVMWHSHSVQVALPVQNCNLFVQQFVACFISFHSDFEVHLYCCIHRLKLLFCILVCALLCGEFGWGTCWTLLQFLWTKGVTCHLSDDKEYD